MGGLFYKALLDGPCTFLHCSARMECRRSTEDRLLDYIDHFSELVLQSYLPWTVSDYLIIEPGWNSKSQRRSNICEYY